VKIVGSTSQPEPHSTRPPASRDQEADPDRRARANVLRLAAAQALAGANASVIFATGAIIGARLAPGPSFATVPISVFVVGMAAGTLPAGWIARHYGRRPAFLGGAGCGVATGLIATVAVLMASFPLYCIATFLGGLYAAVVLSFRFAAADGASVAFRPRALSWVMAGGVFAGVLGPQLVTWTMDLWPPHLFAVSYLAQAAVAVVAMAVLAGVDLPRPAAAELAAGRPLGAIIRQPRFLAAAMCGVVAYALMNLVMTSAPLAMHLCGLPLSASNWAIQWHIVAMYGPSFFTGALIARFGAQRIASVGLVVTLAAAATGLAGTTVAHFSLALVLLGLGWNFGFVGASALVLETHRPEERTKVQAFNDFLVFGTVAVGSFSSGELLATHGWSAVNWVVFPPVAIALAVLFAAGLFGPRAARAS
jgi:MFS family permease